MTAEALSPLNSMQSLRERLIQEGSVVPAASVEELRDTLNRRICKIVDLGKGLENEMFGIYSLIVVRSIGGICKFESECFGDKIPYVQLLRLSLLINKFSEFFNSLIGKRRVNYRSASFARCGFYSPLKESMKNTP